MSHRARAHRSYKPKSKEESDEIALLRATHAVNLPYLNELFPDWSDEDLLYTLQDTFGDLELTVARISEGYASQWGEVKTRKPKKDPPIATQSANFKGSAPRLQDDKKTRVVASKSPRTPRTDRPSNKSSYRTNDHGTLAPASESAGHGYNNSAEASGWNTGSSKQGSGWGSLPQTSDNWGDSFETKDVNSDWGATPADIRYGNKSSHQTKAPAPQNTWASRVAKSTSSTSARDRKPRLNHSKSQEASNSDRQMPDKSRGSADSFPNLNSKDSCDSLIQNGAPKLAPTNTWAKIASLAAQPKTVAPKPVSEAEPENSNWDAPDFVESTQPDTAEEPAASEQPEESSHDAHSEADGDKLPLETSAIPKAGDEVEASQLKKSSNESHHLSHSSGVVIPGTMAAKMGEISKKFAKMETSDLDASVPDQALEGPSTQQTGSKLPPPGIPIVSNGLRSSRPIAASKPSFVPSSFTNGATELEAAPAVAQDAAPEPPSESLSTEAAAQAHVSPAPEQRNGPTAAAQPAKAAQPAAAHTHEAPQHVQQAYYTQGFANTQGAPVHQPPMHPQMMHQHQAQNSYMPYYPQYPYAPGHYNPYQGNNYTLQFAQKSLGGYDDANANFGNIAPGATPTLPQDSGSSTANHTYEKSGHGKHKNYDAANEAGAPPHPGAPVGYGGFGYAGVPSYQAPGGPADGPIYYHHPYYTQPGHQHMFPGYPGAPGLQHLPPHLQQQHAGYSNPHPLQQHQAHQPNPQQQYPPSQQSPHHYPPPHHQQQANPNMRYQSWNN